MAQLIVREPGRVAYTVPLRDELIIGRDPGCDLVLADRQVSRRHVAVRADGARHRLVDLGSTHGALINGVATREHLFADGDLVQIGNVVFAYRGASAPDASILHTETQVGEPRPRKVAAEARRLQILSDLGTALTDLGDPDRLLRAILDAAVAGLGAERGVVGLADGATASGRRIGKGSADEITIDRAVLDAVVGRREAVVIGGAGRSAVATPLVAGGAALGYLYVEENGRRPRFTADDLDFAVAVAGVAAAALTQAIAHRRALDWAELLRRGDGGPELVGDSAAMRTLIDRVRRFAAASDAAVLVRGETGSGKELVARAIHAGSPRAERPFVAFNCAAIPDALLESELFGHERGAFTGADRARRGRFALADGGTLFLDEVGDLSLAAQAKLLRAIEEGEVLPLGAEHAISVDVRLVAATHKPIEDEIAAGRFRADLYYRLAVAELHVPPLRDRGDDAVGLAGTFLSTMAARHGRSGVRLAPAAIELIRGYRWPGNVRQLRNEIERALLLADGDVVDLDDLRLRVGAGGAESGGAGGDLTAMEAGERTVVERALREHAGNVKAAAKALGVSRGTLYRKIEKYGLRSSDDASSA